MKNNNFLFLILIVTSLSSLILFNFALNIEKLTYNFYSEQLAQEQVNQILESQQKWSWIGYAVTPLVILIRTSLVALCISVGLFFYDTENKIKFKQLFRVALLGEFVLVLVGFFKFGYFYFIKTNFTLQDIQQFYPLSYTNFLDLSKIETWLLYPLQTFNLFEINILVKAGEVTGSQYQLLVESLPDYYLSSFASGLCGLFLVAVYFAANWPKLSCFKNVA